MREIKKVVVHCSASDRKQDESPEAIKNLHILPKFVPVIWGEYETFGKGYDDIGYQFIITQDGKVHAGRSVEIAGAHCYLHNHDSIGICLTGNKYFTKAQKASLKRLLVAIANKYELEDSAIYPHNYFNASKTCPNFDLKEVLNAYKVD